MKQILTLTLITLSFSLSAQKDTIFKSNYYDFKLLSDSIELPQKIIDTVDAVVLIADWENQTTKWQFVKAIRTGYKTYMNDYSSTQDWGNGISISHPVYHSIKRTVWDNIEFYDVWENVLYEGKPVWGKLHKRAVLQYYLKPKNE